MTLHKSMIKSNIPHSEKRRNLPKTLSCSSREIHTPVRNKKAAWDRKRKVRNQRKWEAVGRGKVYKTLDADNLLLTGPVMPRRSFPPFWLYLSLSHTGLDTSKVSNGEGNTQHIWSLYFHHLTLRIPLKTPAVSSRERVVREYQVDPVEW